MRRRNGQANARDRSAIAVVGMALRVPGADTPERFWRNVVSGEDCLTRPSLEALRKAGVSRKRLDDPRFVSAAPALRGFESFDATFFDLTPMEVEWTDPAHRVFLECSWEAMERSGIAPGPSAPVTGVFAGVGTRPGGSYLERNLSQRGESLDEPALSVLSRVGNAPEFLSARVSFKLDLVGPSFAVQAACATSLIAIHVAKESLRRGECDVALAGGASIGISLNPGYLSGLEGMLSSDGHIRSFDAAADGTVFGDGVGVVVLRPLEDALAAGNVIHAVLLGSATNNDGFPSSKESFVAPSPEGQVAAITEALADAKIRADTVGYVEAHGTGTRLGDPIEVSSLTDVFRRDTDRRQFCAIGSAKPGVGHLGEASGVVGFIRACLALEHRMLPPAVHFERPNPLIDFEASPFYVPTEPAHWERATELRRAGVSSFGFGGSNAHIVLEEAPELEPAGPSRRHKLFVVSAKTATALDRRLTDLRSHLEEHPDLSATDVAHTLQVGRKAFVHRAALVVDGEVGASELTPRGSARGGQLVFGDAPAAGASAVFLFPGQGAQRPGMGSGLYAAEPVYRKAVDECAEILMAHMGFDLRTLLHEQDALAEDGVERMRQTIHAQPALFVVEYALAKLLLSFGIRPSAMLGHSIGEYVAACLAGVFSLPDALRIVAVRGQLVQRCPRGSMLAVFLSEAELAARLSPGLDLAAVNAPTISVVSGSEDDVARFRDLLAAEGIGFRDVVTSHGFHSAMMEPALPEFRAALGEIALHAPQLPFVSNVSGALITTEEATDPEYWVSQLRRPVRLSDGIEALCAGDKIAFVELGPGQSLTGMASAHDAASCAVGAMPRLATDDEQTALWEGVARLWVAGVPVDWTAVAGEERRRLVRLPTYPFQRRRFWLEPQRPGDRADAAQEAEGHVERLLDEPTRTDSQAPLRFEISWRKTEFGTAAVRAGELWLMFIDDRGLGERLAQQISDSGGRVVALEEGPEFERIGDDHFRIRAGSRSDLEALLETLGSDVERLRNIVHLWSITGARGEHNNAAAFEQSSVRGFYTLVALTQAMDANRTAYARHTDVHVAVVADCMRAISGEAEGLHAEKSALLGPCRAVPQEIPGMTMQAIDVPAIDGDPADWLVEAILGATCEPGEGVAIALRADGRYVEEVSFAAAPTSGAFRLREGGVVLITGAMGGLGLKVAEDLFDVARARLVLLSRWQPPPRSHWAELARNLDDKVGAALATVLALEERGAEVRIEVADVSDPVALSQAVQRARDHFGTIHGIVHAAGALSDSTILSKTREDVEKVFGPKAGAAFTLEDLFAETPLDFFVHFSSEASVRPGPGRSDYTAANAVLDALALRRAAIAPGLSCSIGWGGWREVGMAARQVADAARQQVTEELASVPLSHPLVQQRRKTADGGCVYEGVIYPKAHWVVDEHRFEGRALLPGAALVECVRAAFSDSVGDERAIELAEIVFLRPFFVEDGGREFEIRFHEEERGNRFEVRGRDVGGVAWTEHCAGIARALTEGARNRPISDLPTRLTKNHATRRVTKTADSILSEVSGLVLGHRWGCALGCERRDDGMTSHLRLGEAWRGDLEDFGLHPALLDTAWSEGGRHFRDEYSGLPFSIGSMRIYGPLPDEVFAFARFGMESTTPVASIDFVDTKGRTLVEIVDIVRRQPSEKFNVDESAAAGRPYRLEVSEPGDFSSLHPREVAPEPPGPGEVQIEVVAGGLNFRDVLSALGSLPGFERGVGELGSECSGRISAVGEGVEGLAVGDPVLAMAAHALASHVTTDAHLAVPLPDGLSFEDAAGIPVAFLTANHALCELGRLAEGERVLIHSASGGVGLAAVQIAQAAGAQVFATAGSEEKRDYLRGLGIEHVADSRSLSFVDAVLEATEGEGVDVVLNSLAGEFIGAGLKLLRPFGRFLEIGKRDIYSDAPMGLYPFRQNLSYFGIDLGLVRNERPVELGRSFRALMRRFESGELTASPTRVVPITEAARGFELIARAQHIGKVVCGIRSDPRSSASESPGRSVIDVVGAGISVEAGLEALRGILSSDETPPQVLLTMRDISDVGAVAARFSAATSGRWPRPDLATPYREAKSARQRALVEVWESTLGVEPVGVDDDFFELGGNSITAVQVLHAVSRELGVALVSNAIFNHPTVALLALSVQGIDAGAGDDIDTLLDGVEAISDEEAMRLVRELEEKGGA